jgi:hypothetical protein
LAIAKLSNGWSFAFEKNRVSLAAAGASKVLVAASKEHIRVSTVLIEVLMAVAYLARSRVAALNLVEAGICKPVVLSLSMFPRAPKVVAAGLHAVCELAKRCPSSRDGLGAKGVVSCITSLVTLFHDHEEILSLALKAICALSDENAVNYHLFMELRVVDLARRAKEKYPNNIAITSQANKILDASVESEGPKSTIGSDGGGNAERKGVVPRKGPKSTDLPSTSSKNASCRLM